LFKLKEFLQFFGYLDDSIWDSVLNMIRLLVFIFHTFSLPSQYFYLFLPLMNFCIIIA